MIELTLQILRSKRIMFWLLKKLMPSPFRVTCYQCLPHENNPLGCVGQSAYNLVECEVGVEACLNYTLRDDTTGKTECSRLSSPCWCSRDKPQPKLALHQVLGRQGTPERKGYVTKINRAKIPIIHSDHIPALHL